MKKFITIILALAMVLTMSVPAFADDTAADESAPAQLTSAAGQGDQACSQSSFLQLYQDQSQLG